MADNANSGTGVVRHTVDFFKHLVGFDLNAILSLAAPESTKMAQALAEDIKKRFPKEHWLRGATAYRMVSLLASRVETSAKVEPKPVQEILEKFSDFIEEFGQSLWDESARAESSHGGQKPPAKTDDSLDSDFKKLKRQLLREYGQSVSAAKPEEMDTVQKRFMERNRLLVELEVSVLGSQEAAGEVPPVPTTAPETVKEKTEPESWNERVEKALHPFNQAMVAKLAEWQAEKPQTEMPKEVWKPNWFLRLMAALWVLPWRLAFGKRKVKKNNK